MGGFVKVKEAGSDKTMVYVRDDLKGNTPPPKSYQPIKPDCISLMIERREDGWIWPEKLGEGGG